MGGTSEHSEAATGAAASRHRGGSASPSWGALAPLLGALGTSVGLIGFVVFFGGAILWTQADAVGLPASEVVALVPRTVLLSTGGHFLVAALLLSLLGVGILWVYDAVLRDRLFGAQAVRERRSEERRVQLQQRLDAALERRAEAAESLRLAEQAHLGALQAAAGARTSDVFSSAVSDMLTRHRRAEETLAHAQNELEDVKQDVRAHMPALEKKARAAHERRKSQEMWVRLTALGVPLLALEATLTTFAPIAWYDYVALVALSAATIAVILVIYAETERFLWFGVSAFVAIGLYIGFVTYFRTHDTPRAEPAAALIDGRVPVEGYFVAQTSDRIYFGLPRTGSMPARMIALRRNDVVALAIGKLTATKHDEALRVARELAQSLCADLANGRSSQARAGAAAEDSRPLCPSLARSPAAHLATTSAR